MGIILAKFRKEKSTQEILEALQEKIDTLDTYTIDTQEQKKRFVGNFLAVSIGVYIIAFVVFYFIYFPPTWRERIVYSVPLLLFPIVIIGLRYLFTWYFQRKLNKNSKKLTALRADKKKILEQVMDKETYKVAVNLLARFAEKPGRTYSAMTSNLRTPIKPNQTTLNRSLPTQSVVRSNQLALTSSTPTPATATSSGNTSVGLRLTSKISTSPLTPRSGLTSYGSTSNQLVRRRTPFPVVNQNDKGVFEKIVDVLIGDGPGDRFAMICKECYAHNGMASKEDFEYTTYRCAFCNALNPAKKAKPAAPRLSALPAARAVDSSSDEKDDSDDEPSPIALNNTEFSTPLVAQLPARNMRNASTSSSDEEALPKAASETNNADVLNELSGEKSEKKTENLDKSDSAIDDVTMSPEEN